MGAEGGPDKAAQRCFSHTESNMCKCAGVRPAAVSLHGRVSMFVMNQQQCGEEKKGTSIPHHQGFDLRMHINQSLHYLYEGNMQEKRTLYHQPGAQ